MSGRRPWLRFERFGGSPPRDDEELALAEDGSFTAHRTIGGPRIGSFDGKLAGRTMARMRRLVDAAAGEKDVELPTPRHGATEILETGRRTVRLGSNETAPKPWRALLEQVRRLLEDEIVEHPQAALELIAGERAARLTHAGSEPIEVDLGSVQVRVIRVADDGRVLARWNGRATEGLVDNGERLVPTPAWVAATPGWSAPLPFEHHLELAPGEMFQVWADIPIRDGGRDRDGRLYVPVQFDG